MGRNLGLLWVGLTVITVTVSLAMEIGSVEIQRTSNEV